MLEWAQIDFPLLTVSNLSGFIVSKRFPQFPALLSPSLVGHATLLKGLPGLGSTASLLQTFSILGFDNLTTHMPSPVVPEGAIVRRLPERSTPVAFGSSGMSFLPGYLQPQQLPGVSFFQPVCCICVPAFEVD